MVDSGLANCLLKNRLDVVEGFEMSDQIMKQGFDHPCKGACSGWQQGFERGGYEARLEIDTRWKPLTEKLKTDLHFMTIGRDSNLKDLENEKKISSMFASMELEARKILLEVIKQRDELKDHFMDMLAQGCGNYRSQQYDSLCISTWEHAIRFAFDNGWIKESDVSRW